jgi:hypothetical protein
MVLNEVILDWAVDQQGSNAVEIDLTFHHDYTKTRALIPNSHHFPDDKGGEPWAVYHGSPCDCTCKTASLCDVMGCSDEGEVVDLLEKIRKKGVAMIHVDDKNAENAVGNKGYKGYVSRDDQLYTGLRLGARIAKSLFNEAYTGLVTVGGGVDDEGAKRDFGFFIGALAAIASWAGVDGEQRTWIAWECVYTVSAWVNLGNPVGIDLDDFIAGMKDMKKAMQYSTGWPTSGDNWKSARCDGLTACFHTMIDKGTPKAVTSRIAGELDNVVLWTVDLEDQMRAYLHMGADAIITNEPKQLMTIARNDGSGAAQRWA